MATTNQSFRSINTLFLLIMAFFVLILSGPLLLAGSKLMDHVIRQYGSEILHQHISALLTPVNNRYARLQRFGLEDSQAHQAEIMQISLTELNNFRYQRSGKIFVIKKDKTILTGSAALEMNQRNFEQFFPLLVSPDSTRLVEYTAGEMTKVALAVPYPRWDAYVGISIDKNELFAARNLFVKINFLVIFGALIVAIIFTFLLRSFLITPIIRLADFASHVRKGDYQADLSGTFILELAVLKDAVRRMVTNLSQKIKESAEQLLVIQERESDLQQALEKFQASEKRYRTLIETTATGFVIVDKAGMVIDANPEYVRLTGHRHVDEILGRQVKEWTADHDLERNSQAVENCYETGQIRNLEIDYVWPDGTYLPVEINASMTELHGQKVSMAIMRDISQRKFAEQTITEERERLAVTLRSIGDGVITTDVNGRVVLLNKVAEQLTGWKQGEAMGRPLEEIFHIIHEQSRARCENPVEKVLSSGQIVALANHTILIAKNGNELAIADSGAPIRNRDSEIIGVVLVFRDVTEQKIMEQEMLKARKLESVGVLAGGIAHDFNNILTAILGNIGLAHLDQNLSDRSKRVLSEAEKAVMRAKGLSQQLLTFAKGGEPVKEIASLAEVIRDSAGFVLHGVKAACTFDIPDNLWLTDIDKGQISQVIQNIVLNAIQAMPDGGTINITCENIDQEHKELLPNLTKGRFVKISISDTGGGIPASIVEKIFDPYFSTKDVGSGLGLAISRSIIDKHNGLLLVNSIHGVGCTFMIYLPAIEKTGPAEKAAVDIHHPSSKAKILVMDDEGLVRNVARDLLNALGHQVVLAEDGKEAIELYEQALHAQQKFDLVFMDLTIPGGMGGEAAVKKVLALDPDAKVIVSSGYSNNPIMANFHEAGFYGAIVKPFQLQELEKIIGQALQEQ